MRARSTAFTAGRALLPAALVVAVLLAAAATCLLGCRSKAGRRGPPAASPARTDVPTSRAEEQADEITAGGEAEAEAAGPEDDTAAVEGVHAPEHVATREPERRGRRSVEQGGLLVAEEQIARPSPVIGSSAVSAKPEPGRPAGPSAAPADDAANQVPDPRDVATIQGIYGDSEPLIVFRFDKEPEARETGGALSTPTGADEDAIQVAKRLAPARLWDWWARGPAAFPEVAGQLIMGAAAVSGPSRNPEVTEEEARSRARRRVAEMLNAAVMKVAASYLEEVGGLQAADRDMLVQWAARNVCFKVLPKGQIVHMHRDVGTDTCYALAALRTDVVESAVREQIQSMARETRRMPVDEAKLEQLLRDAFDSLRRWPPPEGGGGPEAF